MKNYRQETLLGWTDEYVCVCELCHYNFSLMYDCERTNGETDAGRRKENKRGDGEERWRQVGGREGGRRAAPHVSVQSCVYRQ